MAKLDETTVPALFQSHLMPGETLQYFGYGVKQPPIWLIVLLVIPGVLPGVIAVALLTKHYVVGLTSQRFVALELKSMSNFAIKNILEYPLSALSQMKVKASTGPIFTHIKIDHPQKPFVAKFHRMGMKT